MTYDMRALTTYVTEDTVVDLLAEAWLVMSDPDDGYGKSNAAGIDSVSPAGYLSDDWSKMARRAIRGFAEANARPDRWPWRDARFDGFGWKP